MQSPLRCNPSRALDSSRAIHPIPCQLPDDLTAMQRYASQPTAPLDPPYKPTLDANNPTPTHDASPRTDGSRQQPATKIPCCRCRSVAVRHVRTRPLVAHVRSMSDPRPIHVRSISVFHVPCRCPNAPCGTGSAAGRTHASSSRRGSLPVHASVFPSSYSTYNPWPIDGDGGKWRGKADGSGSGVTLPALPSPLRGPLLPTASDTRRSTAHRPPFAPPPARRFGRAYPCMAGMRSEQ